ncbi:hypothetical protein [Tabrizicola sp. BL-A-41-H6]|uniref:hypothetical protein n=1 Tax=Tabrizicola sp. BL-A-41-H6 TaxID=3421107 RepID=UPI003D678672
MSAPHTNLEKQRRRHVGPLIGMMVVVVFALGLLFWLMMRTADQGNPTETNEAQIDGRTGEATDAPPVDPTEPQRSTETTTPSAIPTARPSTSAP